MSSTSDSLTRLQSLLSLLASRTDHTIQHFLRLLSHPQGASSLLLTLQYTLALLHAQLVRVLTHRYEELALSIASRASETMLPGEALVATIEAPHLTLTAWCAGVAAARGTVGDVRAFGRLAGLLHVYGRGRELYRSGRRDPAVKVLEGAKLATRAGWQGCENVAFLVRRGVIRGERWEGRERALWRWSWRLWGAELMLEGLKLWRVRGMRWDEELGAQKNDGATDVVGVRSKELEQRWWRDVYAAIGWVPATVHFGFYNDDETSPVGEGWVGLGGIMSGFIGLREAWTQTG